MSIFKKVKLDPTPRPCRSGTIRRLDLNSSLKFRATAVEIPSIAEEIDDSDSLSFESVIVVPDHSASDMHCCDADFMYDVRAEEDRLDGNSKIGDSCTQGIVDNSDLKHQCSQNDDEMTMNVSPQNDGKGDVGEIQDQEEKTVVEAPEDEDESEDTGTQSTVLESQPELEDEDAQREAELTEEDVQREAIDAEDRPSKRETGQLVQKIDPPAETPSHGTERMCSCGSLAENLEDAQVCEACRLTYHTRCATDAALLGPPFRCASCCETFGREAGNMATPKVPHKSKFLSLLLSEKHTTPANFARLQGLQFRLAALRKIGMKKPFVIDQNSDLGFKHRVHSVEDVVHNLGGFSPVPVIDVENQEEAEHWNLFKYLFYFNNRELRQRPMNVISLEVTGTDLADKITRPKTVRELDWSDVAWPPHQQFPKVQLYILMSVENCFTNFHIDFGGTSVFYHLIFGKKIFYLIPPTDANLAQYEKWSLLPNQDMVSLASMVNECYVLEISRGNTLIIPSGWIHAVFTPEDSLVIGGNFLHGLNIEMQIRVAELEDRTGVEERFKYPYFLEAHWYAARYYLRQLEAVVPLCRFELEGLKALVAFLSKKTETTGTEDQIWSLAEQQDLLRNLEAMLNSSIKNLAAKKRRGRSKNPLPPPDQEKRLSPPSPESPPAKENQALNNSDTNSQAFSSSQTQECQLDPQPAMATSMFFTPLTPTSLRLPQSQTSLPQHLPNDQNQQTEGFGSFVQTQSTFASLS